MTNGSAIGYMILAARKRLKLDEELIEKLDRAMYNVMDEYTEDEAEKVYRDN